MSLSRPGESTMVGGGNRLALISVSVYRCYTIRLYALSPGQLLENIRNDIFIWRSKEYRYKFDERLLIRGSKLS